MIMKYFTIEELSRTSTGIDNIPNAEQKENLVYLTENILDPLREYMGVPITVNSGFRSLAVNKAVGGASSSQHMKGEAADVSRGSKTKNKELFEWIKTNCDFDQLINECDYSWIHVSYSSARNRKQILSIG